MAEHWLIDLGSTRLKWQVRSAAGEVLERGGGAWVPGFGEAPLPRVPPTAVWLARVGPGDREQALLDSILRRHEAVPVHTVHPCARAPAGLRLRYDCRQFGVDRYCALLGVLGRGTGPAVVVDAGTAVTIDLLAEGGWHQGGYIIPGYGLGISAVTGLLPESLRQSPAPAPDRAVTDSIAPGNTTVDALKRGWMLGLAAAIDRLGSLAPPGALGDAQWWLTGGDAPWLAGLLEHPARLEPELVLDGLWLQALHDMGDDRLGDA